MESFSVRTSLNQQDWQAYLWAANSRAASAKRPDAHWAMRLAPSLMLFALIGVVVAELLLEPPLLQPEGILLLVVAISGFVWGQRWIQKRMAAPMKGGAFLGALELEFGVRGFQSRRPNSEVFNRWAAVNDVTHTANHVFVWIDASTAYVLPARDLPAGMTPADAAIRLLEFKAAGSAEASATPDAAISGNPPETQDAAMAPPVAPQRPFAPPSVAQELRAMPRLLTWGLVDGARLFGRDATLLLLGVLSFALWAFLDRLSYEGEVELFIYGLAENAALVLGVLFIAWLISRLTQPRVELRRSLLLVLGFLPLFVAATWFAGMLPKAGAIAVMVLLAAWCDRFLRAGLRSMTGASQNVAVPAALAGTVLLVYLSSQGYFSPGIWVEQDAEVEQSAEDQRKNEQIVFEQSARINAEISTLAPRVPGRPNVFFLGFAGYGGQRVFAEEIGLAAKRIGDRYGSAQRSVLLVNDRRDSLKYPLATVPSLRHALNALSQRMNPQEDVLFLSLSSHGSEDATISVNSELGYWRDLGAEELAEMLRESGIRWRVIVVSACFSGSFIDALRDEDTIILTASAADRTSFGCFDENDLTYFGEAFYRDALPNATSLRAAFETARAAIEERESAEDIRRSNPQAHFGVDLEKKLAAIEAKSAH